MVVLNGNIYVATEGEGLFCVDQRTGSVEEIFFRGQNNKRQKLFSSAWDLELLDNHIWIGTNNGLYWLDSSTSVIHTTTITDCIIYSAQSDQEGTLWLGTDMGLMSYDPSSSKQRIYNRNHNLKNREFNRKSTGSTSDGRFWFGGINGISVFRPNEIKTDNPLEPLVYITDLSIATRDSTFSVSFKDKSVTLPWNYNSIEINYVAPNYTNPEEQLYKYTMTGRDPNWVTTNTPKTARYVGLPEGDYIFNVLAANNDKIWGANGDHLNITISPPYWRTWQAYLLYLVAIGGLILLIERLKTYRERVRQVELEKMLIAQKVEQKFITLNNKTKLYLKDLEFIKSDGNYLEFNSRGKPVIDRNKLKSVLTKLPPNFVRVHRSFVINKNAIHSRNSTTVYLQSGIEIPISRTFKSNLY